MFGHNDAMILRTPSPDDSADGTSTGESLQRFTEKLEPWDYATAAIIFVVGIVLAMLVKRLVQKVLRGKNRWSTSAVDPALAALIARLAGYVVITIGFVYALQSLGADLALVLGSLGIAGIAIAFALQDILENFVAGVLLQIQRPFTYGDQILINEHEGTVQRIDTRNTTILTPAGELVKIPSATVIKSDLTNYTQRGSRRTSLPIGVAYGTDLRNAQEVILAAVKATDGVLATPTPEAYLEAFGESSIDFSVRFWHRPKIADFWLVRSEVAFAVEAALADADITIPFPQRTMWWAGETEA